jgi:hypothetical protein
MTKRPISVKLEYQQYTTTSSTCTIKVSATFNIEIEKLRSIYTRNTYNGELTEESLIQLIKERK